jgi:predicted exporter
LSRRGVALALWIVVLAACALAISRAHFVADLSSFLPAAPTAEQRLLVDQLREGAVSRVMLVGIEGGDAPRRAALSRALVRALRSDAHFVLVANGEDLQASRERELVFENRYVLSPAMSPQRFTVEGLRAAIAETIEQLASPAGLALKSLVPRDPTLETLAAAEALRPAQGPRLVEGVWASADGRRAVMILRARAAGSDIDAQGEALGAVQRAFATAGPAADMRLLVTGPGVFAVQARAMVRHDVERLAAASLAIVALLLLAAYRSALALALGLVPVVTGALVGVAAVSLGFGTVHGITLGFGTTLIGEAVDYAVYLFVQGSATADARRATFWSTIRLGVLTSIAGFCALLFSGLPGLAQLGLYSIAGLAAAALATRYVLPAMLPATMRIRDLSPLGARLALTARRASSLRWLPIALAVAAVAVLAYHRATLWDAQLSSLNPIPAADRRLDEELRAGLGASDARYMVAVQAATADAALEAAERVGLQLDALVQAGTLGGYESPARFLPSRATQRTRLASLPDAATLRERLRVALAGSALRAEKLEPFIADAERARAAPLLTRAALSGTALDAPLDGLLFRDGDGRWTALIGLRAAAQKALDAASIRKAVPDALVIDLKSEVDRLYAGYLERALVASAVGLAAIVALLFFSLRSPRRVARVMAPLVAAILLVAAMHALAGTRLSLLHLVGLLLVVAIGSNYALFFDRMAQDRDPAAERTLASLALANATTVASFGVLALSSIPVLHAIGSTVALGALFTLLFAAIQFAHGKNDIHAHHRPRPFA